MTIVFFDREEQRVREIERRTMTRLCGVRLDAQCCTPGDAAARHPAGARWGIVAPGNSFGLMDGGLDAAIAQALPEVEALVRSEIETVYFGELPVGAAVTVVTSTWDAALEGCT